MQSKSNLIQHVKVHNKSKKMCKNINVAYAVIKLHIEENVRKYECATCCYKTMYKSVSKTHIIRLHTVPKKIEG